MPVHDGSRSDQDERLSPPGPERSQRHPEQLVQGSSSTARLLRVQSQQLPTESQVLEDEVLAGTENADQPTEEMSERCDHSRNHIGKARIQPCPKSFILQVYEVLARYSPFVGGDADATDQRREAARLLTLAAFGLWSKWLYRFRRVPLEKGSK
jgi:hypothetical protein